jgi:type II secretory pathway component PulK
MVSPSELLLVAHMTPEIYKRLLPHITVWPARPNPTGTDGDGINVNTATPNVLRALKVPPAENGQSFLGEPATLQEIEPILTLQQQEGGIAREYPLGSLFAGAGGADTIVDTGLAVSSDFFLLDGHVTIGGVATHMQSVISRKNPERIQVILRTTGGL